VPLTGAADAPDDPASPMPAAAKPTIKIVRIMISPSISTAPNAFLLMHSLSRAVLPSLLFFYLQTAIADIIIALNLVFSTLPSFICCSFLTYFSVIYHTQALMSTAGATV
jgi:hypothetical protein